MKGRRVLSGVAVAVVAGIAAWVSYGHMRTLAATHGQEPVSAALLPFSADGLVAVAALAMAVDRAAGCRRRPWALLGFWLGVAVSVMANWGATNGGIIAHLISAWAPVAFLVAVEILTQPAKPRRATATAPATTPAPVAEPATPDLAPVAPEPVAVTSKPAPRPQHATVPEKRAARYAATRRAVAAALAEAPNATGPELAAMTGLPERTASRHAKEIRDGQAATVAPVNGAADLQLALN